MSKNVQQAAKACGIDFGTSNSTVGWSRPGQSTLLPLEDGNPTLPSVIFFHAENGHSSFGRAALSDYLEGHEGRMMRSLKSLLGTSMMDGHTEMSGKALPFRDLLGMFICELKRRAEQATEREFTQAVLGRPVFFVDDDVQADQLAQRTLEDLARNAGLRDIEFQYEPIAAAFDYESQISREELVLVVDIGGGTSDFALIRLGPQRALRLDRRDDILASGGIHIGGTDFDRALNLACMMPRLGMGSLLKSGLEMPSAQYFNLATWHSINLAYTRQAEAEIEEMHRKACDRDKLGLLKSLVGERAGHWLAMQVEEAKIALTTSQIARIDIDRLSMGEAVPLTRNEMEIAIRSRVAGVERAVAELLKHAGIAANGLNTVVFTGGSSSVPLLRNSIMALVPRARCVEGDLFGSIGAGLALDARRKFGT